MTTCTLWRCVISLALSLSFSYFLSFYVVEFVQEIFSPPMENFCCGCPLKLVERTGMVRMACLLARSLYTVVLIMIIFDSFYFKTTFVWSLLLHFISVNFILDNFISFFYVFAYTLSTHARAHTHTDPVSVVCFERRLFVYSGVHLLCCYQWRVSVSRVRVYFLS